MEYSYRILTKRMGNGEIKTSVFEDCTPMSTEGDNITPEFQRIYGAVINTHLKAMKIGELEEIATEFKSEARAVIF